MSGSVDKGAAPVDLKSHDDDSEATNSEGEIQETIKNSGAEPVKAQAPAKLTSSAMSPFDALMSLADLADAATESSVKSETKRKRMDDSTQGTVKKPKEGKARSMQPGPHQAVAPVRRGNCSRHVSIAYLIYKSQMAANKSSWTSADPTFEARRLKERSEQARRQSEISSPPQQHQQQRFAQAARQVESAGRHTQQRSAPQQGNPHSPPASMGQSDAQQGHNPGMAQWASYMQAMFQNPYVMQDPRMQAQLQAMMQMGMFGSKGQSNPMMMNPQMMQMAYMMNQGYMPQYGSGQRPQPHPQQYPPQHSQHMHYPPQQQQPPHGAGAYSAGTKEQAVLPQEGSMAQHQVAPAPQPSMAPKDDSTTIDSGKVELSHTDTGSAPTLGTDTA